MSVHPKLEKNLKELRSNVIKTIDELSYLTESIKNIENLNIEIYEKLNNDEESYKILKKQVLEILKENMSYFSEIED